MLCSFAASSTLARQIEQGADADLFLSADERWADFLSEKGLADQRRDLLANRLVIVCPTTQSIHLDRVADLAGSEVKRLALALDPVPAGHYAREALEKAGIWEQVKGRVREAGDVRATLAIVERDEADAGIVYATDAVTSKKVRMVLEVPEDLHAPDPISVGVTEPAVRPTGPILLRLTWEARQRRTLPQSGLPGREHYEELTTEITENTEKKTNQNHDPEIDSPFFSFLCFSL